ncbi:sigma-70 family RNA polymerase sigma factor [Magnetococcus sp. PR-3]|uniref:sigma-70 family RNA polymerase sigma factor n=1 Tax=Magnetococcus sp. PR-3 TaxID=3120355 RepID=UPI002FCE245B
MLQLAHTAEAQRLLTESAQTDAELLQQVASGDEQAAQQLVRNHANPLYGLARRLLDGWEAEAEDVVQDAFLRLWKQARSWRPEARIHTWLHRVTYNLCMDRLRKKSGVSLDSIAEPEDPRQDLHQYHQRQQKAARIEAALAALPRRQCAAITLVHHQGFTQQEAAEIMEIGVKALESLLSRGRKQLRSLLADLDRGA